MKWKSATLTVMLMAATLIAAQSNDARTLIEAARKSEVVDGDLRAAIRQYSAVVEKYATSDRAAAADALLRMAECHQKLADGEAQSILERLVRDFSDQKAAAARAAAYLATKPPSTPAAREVATGREKRESKPSLDGRYLSFTDTTGNVAVRDIVTRTDRRVSEGADWFSEYVGVSAISPDGRQVAYSWYIHKENKAELRVVGVTSGASTRPTTILRDDLSDVVYQISWMPDGKRLVAIRNRADSTSQIGIVTIQDGSFRSIKSLEWHRPNLLSLSPDGRYIAYDVPSGDAGSPRDITVLATDGSRETVAVRNPADDSFPVWAPDGSALVFLSDRSGSPAVWTVGMKDGGAINAATMLKGDVGQIRLQGVTATGTLFYFQPSPNLRTLYLTELDAVRAVKPPVVASERIANDNVGPTWSRDGHYLAYYSFRDTSRGSPTAPLSGVLVVRSATTGEERTVPLPPRISSRFGAGPKWFPDNRSVLVEAADTQGSGFGFYRLALDSGNTEQVAHISRESSSYDLSADGRTLFCAVVSGDGGSLWRLDLESHGETELRHAAGTASEWEIIALALSPDGSQLATILIGGVVVVSPATGGSARELFRPATRELGTGVMRQAVAWTPDQRFVLFGRSDQTMWKVPAIGGSAEKVISVQAVSPTVHPDGKRLVFHNASAPDTSKVIALENFLASR